jgi:hypothetical protein
VVHDLFEEQTSLEKVTLKIMQRAQRLLKCERAAVLLLDETSDTVTFSKLFELTSPTHSANHMRCGLNIYCSAAECNVNDSLPGNPVQSTGNKATNCMEPNPS